MSLVEAVDRIELARDCPRAIRADNRLKIMSKALYRWAYANGVTPAFSRPGKPTDNTFVKPFNGRLRDESLNTHWFLSLDDARAKLKTWRRDFNETQPHTSLGLVTAADEEPDLSLWPDTKPVQGQSIRSRPQSDSSD